MRMVKKERVRSIFRYIPLYKKEKKRELAVFNMDILEGAVRKAICNVPYYKSYRYLLNSDFDISKFPILRKDDIMCHEKEFVSNKAIKRFLSKVETGGSTGHSLELFYSPSTLIKKTVITDYAFSLIGDNLKIATLRGNKPSKGQLYEWINDRMCILSSYQLNEDNLDSYLKIIKENQIECIHAYPSSLSILMRLIKNKYGIIDLPYLKGILTSSEIFSKEDKSLVRDVCPNVKLVDFYGHNELACCAIAIDDGYYKFYDNYGYVEFVDTEERTPAGNRVSEIVATSIMNETMPFIRYATDDYVELDDENNVVSIIGRTSDFVVNKLGQIAPCIFSPRDISMKNVISFQYYQCNVGELIFNVTVNTDFGPKDISYLEEDLIASFSNMICNVKVVEELTKTKMGKQLRLIQLLNLNDYK